MLLSGLLVWSGLSVTYEPYTQVESWSALHEAVSSAATNTTFSLSAAFISDYQNSIKLSAKQIKITGGGAVLDASGKGSFFELEAGAGLDISFVTMKNGRAAKGGAISLGSDPDTTNKLAIRSVVFVNNTASEDGGALSLVDGHTTIVGAAFINNSAECLT